MFVGLTGALIGSVWFAQRAHFEFDAITTSDGETFYELTLRWIDQNGRTHVTVPRVKASFYIVPVGTELDIKYDPNDPNDPADVRVKTREGPWYFPRLILFGSFMSFAMGRFMRGRPQS